MMEEYLNSLAYNTTSSYHIFTHYTLYRYLLLQRKFRFDGLLLPPHTFLQTEHLHLH